MRLEDILVNIETALPLGLITNELLTNAYKYAFPGKYDGILKIILRKDNPDSFTLNISDNGVGLPDGFDFDKQDSLGMFIIRLLVEQLDGSISFTTNGGVSASIEVPCF